MLSQKIYKQHFENSRGYTIESELPTEKIYFKFEQACSIAEI